MRVRQLVGNRAGEIVDLPYAVAMQCLRSGTAIRPEIEARDTTPKVRASEGTTRIPQTKRRRGRPRKHPR